jgi:hypothetical protein
MAKNPAQGQRSTTDPKVLEAAAVGDAVTVDATTSLPSSSDREEHCYLREYISRGEKNTCTHVYHAKLPNKLLFVCSGHDISAVNTPATVANAPPLHLTTTHLRVPFRFSVTNGVPSVESRLSSATNGIAARSSCPLAPCVDDADE